MTQDQRYHVTMWHQLRPEQREQLRRTNAEWDAHFRDMREQALAFRARQRQVESGRVK